MGECKANDESERALAVCVPLIKSGKLRAGGLRYALHAQRFNLLVGVAMGRCMPHSASVPLRVADTEMYQEKRVWVRGSLEVKTEHSTQFPPRRPVPSACNTRTPIN